MNHKAARTGHRCRRCNQYFPDPKALANHSKAKHKARYYSLRVIPALLVLAVAAFLIFTYEPIEEDFATGVAEIYSSPSCGCCKEYTMYLRENGFGVNSIETDDLEAIKDSFGIPRSMWSCHTVRVGRYFVEGHAPIEAIERLLGEQPKIDGIALPGMPSGSPGMGGIKTDELIIYSILDWEISEFQRL